jgi:hypothetical protein
MAGYLVASSLYSSTLALLRSGKLAAEEAERVEYLCAAAAADIEVQAAELERFIDEHLNEQKEELVALVGRLEEGKEADNCELIILAISDLAHSLGLRLKFGSFAAFDNFMVDEESPLRL